MQRRSTTRPASVRPCATRRSSGTAYAWARYRPGQRDGRLTRKHVVRRRSGKFATWRRKSRTSIQLRKSRGLAVCADGEAKIASIASATGIAWGHVAEPGLNCCGPTFALSGGCNEKIHSERVISGGVHQSAVVILFPQARAEPVVPVAKTSRLRRLPSCWLISRPTLSRLTGRGTASLPSTTQRRKCSIGSSSWSARPVQRAF